MPEKAFIEASTIVQYRQALLPFFCTSGQQLISATLLSRICNYLNSTR